MGYPTSRSGRRHPASSSATPGPRGSTRSDIPDISGTYATASHNHALADISQSSATTGQFPRWNGASWVSVSLASGDLPDSYLPLSGGTITGETTYDEKGHFLKSIDVGGSASTTPASIRLFEGGILGTENLTIIGPTSIATSYSIQLPAASGASGDVLKASTAGPTNVLEWGAITVDAVDGETFALTTPAGGDLLAFDGSTFVNFASGSTGEVLTTSGTGGVEWAPAPGSTLVVSIPVGPLESPTIRCALPRAPGALTLTRVDVHVQGTGSPSVSYQIDLDGADAFGSSQSASAGLTSISSFSSSAVQVGDSVLIDVVSVSGSVSDVAFELTFAQ